MIYYCAYTLQITGIDGTYRCTCESVIKVLRHNKDSLMAVLEAFVYDPLLNWKLIETAATKVKRSKTRTTAASGESVTNSVIETPGEFLEGSTSTLPGIVPAVLPGNKKGPPEELGG